MTNSRDKIFKRLRRVKPDIPIEQQNDFSPDVDLNREEKIAHFKAQMTTVRAEVYQVSENDWIDKLKQLCQEKQLKNLLYAPDGPLGSAINAAWQAENLPTLIANTDTIETWKEELFFHVDAAITSTKAGIAETGTLIVWPTEEEPRSYSLIPPIHIAVLHADKLYNTFEEALAQEQWQDGMPTNALLISGPSKSADIEQTLAYGVHGPTELIVLLIRD